MQVLLRWLPPAAAAKNSQGAPIETTPLVPANAWSCDARPRRRSLALEAVRESPPNRFQIERRAFLSLCVELPPSTDLVKIWARNSCSLGTKGNWLEPVTFIRQLVVSPQRSFVVPELHRRPKERPPSAIPRHRLEPGRSLFSHFRASQRRPGRIFHLITAWKSTTMEQQLYAENT